MPNYTICFLFEGKILSRMALLKHIQAKWGDSSIQLINYVERQRKSAQITYKNGYNVITSRLYYVRVTSKSTHHA